MFKLQRYILREHIAPLILAFFVITFLLVIDYVPKIIDRVIDKDLNIWIVLELVGLNLAWMLALSVPMSVLVATLMAFGRLSADFEIIAVKAAGINLLHIILPLLIAGGGITYLMIEFNDKVLPDWNQRARLLRGDIAAMRPTLSLKSGIFIPDLAGYLILIEDINHTTSKVTGVTINDNRDPAHPKIIFADYGFLAYTDNGMTMRFTLFDGEVHSLDMEESENYRKLDFKTQVINIQGAGSELIRTNTEYRTDREMDLAQMRENVARAREALVPILERVEAQISKKLNYLFADSFAFSVPGKLADSSALEMVRSDAKLLFHHLERNRQQIRTQENIKDKYDVEIYKKYSIPAASLAFILIGAPLGMLSRRGGMGVAVGISILLFIVYWAFLIGGEDMAERGMVDPFWAMWSANFLIGGIGIYLLIKVINEKPLFSFVRRRPAN